MAAVMAPVLIFYLPTHSPKPQERVLDKLRYMDWLGAGLIAAVFITFTVSLTFGGARWSWGSYRFILTITFSGVAVIATVLTQHFAILTTEARRIFPARFLRSRTLMLIFFATSACNTGLFIGTYYIPLVFQFARSDSAIKAAVRLLPFICVTITFILLNGALMPKFGYYMPWYLCSGVFMIIGGSLLHTINADTSPSRIYGYSVLLAIGCGSALQSGYSIAAVKVKPEEVVAAIGFINIAQLGSTVIALNIAGSVFQNLAFNNLKAALADHHYTAAELRSAIAGTQSVIFQQGDETVKQKAIQAIIKTMDSVFVLAIAAGAVSVISAVFMKRERLIMSAAAGG